MKPKVNNWSCNINSLCITEDGYEYLSIGIIYINLISIKHHLQTKLDKCKLEDIYCTLYLENLSLIDEDTCPESIILKPHNYCTPFDRSCGIIHLKFASIEKLMVYIRNNQINIKFQFYYKKSQNYSRKIWNNQNLVPDTILEKEYDFNLNSIIKPINDVYKPNIIISAKYFEVKMSIALEWIAIKPEKYPMKSNSSFIINKTSDMKDIESNLSKKNIYILGNQFAMQNRHLYSILLSPKLLVSLLPAKIYEIYEQSICEDPLIFNNCLDINNTNIYMIKNSDIKKINNNKDSYLTDSSHLNISIFGGWSIHIHKIYLNKRGFTYLGDLYPLHRNNRSYRIYIQHYIKDSSIIDENKTQLKNCTPIRGHWCIINPKLQDNYLKYNQQNKLLKSKEVYESSLNIHSRIPEVIKENLELYSLYFNIITPKDDNIKWEDLKKNHNIFCHGNISSNKIFINKENSVLLYTLREKPSLIGYMTLTITNIKDLILKSNISENINFKDNNSPLIDQTQEDIYNKLNKQKKNNILIDQLSLLFFFLYIHLELISNLQNMTYMESLNHFYQRIIKDKLNHPKNFYFLVDDIYRIVGLIPYKYLNYITYITRLLDNLPKDQFVVFGFNHIVEILSFPHLKLLDNLIMSLFDQDYEDISLNNFLLSCESLGVQDYIAITWYYMIQNTSKSVNYKTSLKCLDKYGPKKNLFYKPYLQIKDSTSNIT
ncbi:uncharacterized protein CMU_026880 [Cryptosporidium muris RN66]|uniref:Uncharacterized protein n=1 Tax=Cryptosporidium muris (strain RN66) TaxID=441375 RepID=B6ABC8_CRYMR|nr:uncharacterized protein CMU_026880 [Cryptosporidium muris RN66]EEA05680.1 hypothetical protein CMU_026880 [Cryptosporidium muris RN66]|eukprot:XP_002140029.1 hypothetical protein [Cryptosporidium muris RN66]